MISELLLSNECVIIIDRFHDRRDIVAMRFNFLFAVMHYKINNRERTLSILSNYIELNALTNTKFACRVFA